MQLQYQYVIGALKIVILTKLVMIGYLSGKIKDVKGNQVILFSNGIGWTVNVGVNDYLIDQEVEIYTHLVVREQEMSLYGFETSLELNLFELLIEVSGVGPKTAILLVKEKGVGQVANSIIAKDISGLKVTGVGKKTAEKIILELKDKIEKLNLSRNQRFTSQSNINSRMDQDVLEAMIGLGYKSFDVERAYESLLKDRKETEELESEELIKLLLKYI